MESQWAVAAGESGRREQSIAEGRGGEAERGRIGDHHGGIGQRCERMRRAAEARAIGAGQGLQPGGIDRRIDGARQIGLRSDRRVSLPIGRSDHEDSLARHSSRFEQDTQARGGRGIGNVKDIDEVGAHGRRQPFHRPAGLGFIGEHFDPHDPHAGLARRLAQCFGLCIAQGRIGQDRRDCGAPLRPGKTQRAHDLGFGQNAEQIDPVGRHP